jgi:hypothetical protein
MILPTRAARRVAWPNVKRKEWTMPAARSIPQRNKTTYAAARGALLAALAAVGLTAVADASHFRLVASQDPRSSVASSFTVDFGDFGADSAVITQTDLTLEVNPENGKARLLSYHQVVPSLDLPGGIPTGPITVDVVAGSSDGTYAEARGAFATTEVYSIAFAEDLSGFGLFSPVLQAGSSSGSFSLTDGTLHLAWTGQGQFGDPNDPVVFAYDCKVHAKFVVEYPCHGDADGDGVVGQSDLGLVLSAYGRSTGQPGFNPAADFDVSGTVDQEDLGELLAAYDTSCR